MALGGFGTAVRAAQWEEGCTAIEEAKLFFCSLGKARGVSALEVATAKGMRQIASILSLIVFMEFYIWKLIIVAQD